MKINSNFHNFVLMRKGLLSILLILYALLSFGVEVNVHYCGDKVAGGSLYNIFNKINCCCAAKKAAKTCCKNQTTYFQLKVEQINKVSIINFLPSCLEKLSNLFFIEYPKVNVYIANHFTQLINYDISPTVKHYRIILNVFRI